MLITLQPASAIGELACSDGTDSVQGCSCVVRDLLVVFSLSGEFIWTSTAGSRVVTISPFKCNFVLNASTDKHLWSMFVASSNIHELTAEVICAL